MKNYSIYNASSENMSAVADNSVDSIVFAPPYNINTPYSDQEKYDHKSFEEYRDMLSRIIRECFRVLKPTGLFINESADTIYSDGKLIALSGLIQKLCLDAGFKIKERHINFLQSEAGVELVDREHNWSKVDYYSEDNAHSNCHQWIVMAKDPSTTFEGDKGKIFYINYPSDEEGHPCPFSPEHVRIFLDLLKFAKGMTVLESFMGTARLGVEVVSRGGNYVGYELEKKHFETAQNKFAAI
jgi:DNA modification methylase